MTTERAARCAAARTAFTQYAKYYRSKAPYHFRRVVAGAVTSLTDIDIRILHGCLVSLLYKFLGRRAYMSCIMYNVKLITYNV